MKKTNGLFLSLAMICFSFSAFSQQKNLVTSFASKEIAVDPNSPPLPMDGNLKDGEFALTFDDGPDPLTTPKILEILKKHGIKATFFEVGSMVEAQPEITRQILKAGHSVGSHSWNHADLATLAIDEAMGNIKRGHKAVELAGNFHTPFFRFPFFSWTDELMTVVRGLGLTPFHANVVTEDWMTPDPKELLEKSLGMLETEKHGIILFHDIQPQTAEMLDAFLDEFEARGYTSVVFRAK